MYKRYLAILLCVLITLTLSPTLSFGSGNIENKEVNGQFILSVLHAEEWVNVGSLDFGRFYSKKPIDIGDFIKENGLLKIKITKVGGGSSHIDAVLLEDKAPILVNEGLEKDLAKVLKSDFDVLNVENDGLTLVFNAHQGDKILKVYGRIEEEVISKVPFTFPLGIPDFYNYSLDSNIITSEYIFKDIYEGEPFLKEYLIPGSGHPEGDIYIWVENDSDNLYVRMDFTSDNTIDGEKDYAKVNVNTAEGLKEFKITQSETKWGKAHFMYTDKVEYEHKVYEFIIPLAEIGIELGEVSLSFEAYGTAAASPFYLLFDKFKSSVSEDVGSFELGIGYIGYSWYGDQTINVRAYGEGDSGKADEGSDYTISTDPLEFTGSSLDEKYVIINIIEDRVIEDVERFYIEFTNVPNDQHRFTGTAEIVINDNDLPYQEATFSFSSPTYSVDEGDREAVITVEMDFEDSEPQDIPSLMISQFTPRIDYTTADGTAKAGLDYTETYGTLEFIDGDTLTFSVPIEDDLLVEGNETIRLVLSPTEEVYERSSIDKPVIESTLTIEDNDNTQEPEPDPEPEPEPEPKPERETEPKAVPPSGGVVIRRPDYIDIGDPIEKFPYKKDEVIIKYSQMALDENEESVPVVCYWNTKYKKWVALTTLQEGEEGKAKAFLEGKYKGWFRVYASGQPIFIDIDENINENTYLRLNNLGVLEGYSIDNKDLRLVLVEKNISKNEFATLIYRLMNLDYSNVLIPELTSEEVEEILMKKFTDNSIILPWNRNIIASLSAKDIVEAVDGALQGDKDITVIEAAKIINRAIKQIPKYKTINFDKFKEDDTVADWAKAALRDGTLEDFIEADVDLEKTITREDALMILYKLFITNLGW